MMESASISGPQVLVLTRRNNACGPSFFGVCFPHVQRTANRCDSDWSIRLAVQALQKSLSPVLCALAGGLTVPRQPAWMCHYRGSIKSGSLLTSGRTGSADVWSFTISSCFAVAAPEKPRTQLGPGRAVGHTRKRDETPGSPRALSKPNQRKSISEKGIIYMTPFRSVDYKANKILDSRKGIKYYGGAVRSRYQMQQTFRLADSECSFIAQALALAADKYVGFACDALGMAGGERLQQQFLRQATEARKFAIVFGDSDGISIPTSTDLRQAGHDAGRITNQQFADTIREYRAQGKVA